MRRDLGLEPLLDEVQVLVEPGRGANDSNRAHACVPSVKRFPPADELAELMRAAGFADVRFELVAGGPERGPAAWRFGDVSLAFEDMRTPLLVSGIGRS